MNTYFFNKGCKSYQPFSPSFTKRKNLKYFTVVIKCVMQQPIDFLHGRHLHPGLLFVWSVTHPQAYCRTESITTVKTSIVPAPRICQVTKQSYISKFGSILPFFPNQNKLAFILCHQVVKWVPRGHIHNSSFSS